MSDAPVPMNEPPRRRRPPSRNINPETGERLTLPEKVLPSTLAPMEEAPAEPAGPTQEERDSAYDLIGTFLDEYGLGGLEDFVVDLVFTQGIVSENELMT